MLTSQQFEKRMDECAKYLLSGNLSSTEIRSQMYQHVLRIALAMEGYNICHVARRLKTHRNTISRQLDELLIPRPRQVHKEWAR